MSARAARLLIAAAALLLCAGIPASAELSKEGDLVVSFDGGLSPTRLPRKTVVPVAVRVAGNVKSATATRPRCRSCARSRSRSTARAVSSTAACRPARSKTIQPATEAAARAICAGAIVGSGHVTVRVHIPSQPPFTVRPTCSPSTAPAERPQADPCPGLRSQPPWGLHPHLRRQQAQGCLRHRDEHHPAPLGPALGLPHPLRHDPAPHLHLPRHPSLLCLRRLHRPGRLSSAFFPFAKATYGFDNGSRLTTSVARRCEVRG